MASYVSVLDLFYANVSQSGDKAALMDKQSGAYASVTWRTLADEVERLAAGLLELGVQPGERVAILSQTRREWILADLANLAAAAVTVPIYPSSVGDECRYIIAHSDAVIVFAEDRHQVEKLRAQRAALPLVKHVIQFEGDVPADDDWVLRYADVVARAEVDADALSQRRSVLSHESILTIIYTSGTTGKPKGVVTTHGAMLYEAEAIIAEDIIHPDDVQLLFLPLAHTFAKVLMLGWLATRHVLALAENIDSIRDNMREIRPTLMAGVPRVWEKMFTAILQQGAAQGWLRAALLMRAVEMAEKHGRAEAAGTTLQGSDAIWYGVCKRLVFPKVKRKLREAMGGRIRLMVSGGAPLALKIAWFFKDAGLEILEGYGMTETTAATCVNRPGELRVGTVGPALPGTELRIADDGEVMVRGPGLMKEYWKDPEATAATIRDGWLYTGDIGYLDAHDHLVITDRKKDLIITAGGKNIAPQGIENALKADRLISQAVVHGDRRKFLTALITLEGEALEQLAEGHGWRGLSHAQLSKKPEVYACVQERIDALNGRLPSHETIKKFHILEHDFSPETGELTPTLKVRRKFISERYRTILDGFYEEQY